MASRSHQTNSNELEALKSKTRNKNTYHSTGTWINTFQSWAKERGLNQELSSYVPHDLNDVLMKFYAELRKADGSEYFVVMIVRKSAESTVISVNITGKILPSAFGTFLKCDLSTETFCPTRLALQF